MERRRFSHPGERQVGSSPPARRHSVSGPLHGLEIADEWGRPFRFDEVRRSPMDYVDRPYLVRTPSQRYANRWQFVSSRPVTPPGPTQVLPVSPLSTLVAHAQPQQPQGQQSQPASPALRPGAIVPAPGQVPPPSPQAPFGSPPLLSSARPLQAISPGRLEAEQGPSKRLGPYKNDLIAVKPIVYGPPPHPFRPATTASYQIIDTQVPSPENPLADTCPYYTYSQELYTQQPPQQPQPYIADPLEQTQKPYLLYPAQPQPPQQQAQQPEATPKQPIQQPQQQPQHEHAHHDHHHHHHHHEH